MKNLKNLTVNIPAVSKTDYYERILSLLNTEAPVDRQSTAANLELLAHFMALPEEHNYMPFSSRARRIVSKKYYTPLSSALLSMRVRRLLDAGLVVKDEDGFLDFSPSVKKIRDSNSFTINVSISTEDNPTNSLRTKSST